MGNVFLNAKIRDYDIQSIGKDDIDGNCLVLCLTNQDIHLERDEELFYGRLRAVPATVLKTAYQETVNPPL